MSASEANDKAVQLYDSAIVWDNVWPWEPWCGNDFDKVPVFLDEGITCIGFTVAGDFHTTGETFHRLAQVRKSIENNQQCILVNSINDIETAKQQNKLGMVLQFEGSRCLERDKDLIHVLFELGVKQNILAFNQANSLGGGCAEEVDGGLTRFGAAVVKEMNQVGMLVDLSHTGRRTSLDVIEISEKPVVFSHSNANAVHSHFRNLTDEQIRACAESGGLIGLSGSSVYLGSDAPGHKQLFKHIDYVAELVGSRSVVLGTDWVGDPAPLADYMKERPEEWPDATDPNWKGPQYCHPSELRKLTAEMLSHGYSDDDILGILGKNYLRLFESVFN